MKIRKPFAHALVLTAMLSGAVIALAEDAADSKAPAGPTPAPAGVIAWGPEHWNQMRGEFWKSRKADQGAIVFAGDSMIHAWGTLADDFPKYKVAKRGIGGDTTVGLKFRLQEDVLDLNPKAVVIIIGVNDFRISHRPPADAAEKLKGILDAIAEYKADLPVVLCLLLPTGGGEWDPITKYNEAIRKMAGEYANVTLCDTFTPFANANGGLRAELSGDGLHPNPAGFAVWKQALDPIFAELFSKKRAEKE
ncbi:MAG: GDSL-type esterase/lipase family protein [Pirellulales bacterium]